MTTTTIGSVTSADGTTIGYREIGHGPGLVILHGAMQTGDSQLELAEALSQDFTCYLPDRRGRGRSGPVGPGYGLHREVEDLAALIDATGARHVAGVSSGAIITLRTLLVRPDLDSAVVFEPPLFTDGSAPAAGLPRLDRELAAGRTAAALVTGMKAAQLGPPIFQVMPRRVLELLTGLMLKGGSKDAAPGGAPTFEELAPTLRQDIQVAVDAAGDLTEYGTVRPEVLLLSGSKSPAYLRAALERLERILPHARRTLLDGLDHSATSNAAQRGRPERVAAVIRPFLAPGRAGS
ncbi:alpha/beta hydrolase [Nonomuraea sp. WAC 01424]|uniref:alpha/beta fold hydrolase n=1 Tax=Nonomuraea sp. WAC 01424 TaxID=2203200 RepID=UPI000F7A59A4|nr:alpha/beta hydrolase [Nonomuraea sp. WAC 01424]RSN09232.1 alpha/beta hydrolase [Nonomuraea sp. WAC 01424]